MPSVLGTRWYNFKSPSDPEPSNSLSPKFPIQYDRLSQQHLGFLLKFFHWHTLWKICNMTIYKKLIIIFFNFRQCIIIDACTNYVYVVYVYVCTYFYVVGLNLQVRKHVTSEVLLKSVMRCSSFFSFFLRFTGCIYRHMAAA